MTRFDIKHFSVHWQTLSLLINRRQQWLVLTVFMLLALSAAFHVGSYNLLLQGKNAGKVIAIYEQLKADIDDRAKHESARPVAHTQDAPAVITTAAVMTAIRSLAKKQSLSIREISTDVRQEQDGNHLLVSLEARGSYRHIKSLLAGLQQAYPQLRYDTLRIEKSKRGSLSLWLKFTPGQVGVS